MHHSHLPLLTLALAATTSALPALNAAPAPQSLCTDNGNLLLPGTPYIVYNMLYNAAQTVGTQCTAYVSQSTTNNTQLVNWSSTTHIEDIAATSNVPKGYSFIGLTQNLATSLAAIAAIPASYTWSRTNTTAFKGNTVFDFIVAPTAGDSTSPAAKELMLWLQYEGGQLPIGWSAAGPAATVPSLFGTSWKLYEGTNEDTGVTVHSLLADEQFSGRFAGDLREWMEALVGLGRIGADAYVNVGNAGTEMFWGDAVMEATVGLGVEV